MGAAINKNHPASWDDLLQYDLSCINGCIGRESNVDDSYTMHKRKLYEQGISLEDYIYGTVLRGKQYIFSKNKFPYWVEPGITHYVFWMRPECKLHMFDVKKKIEKELGCNVIIFENTPNSQSVGSIPHYHIFVNEYSI